MRSVLCLCLALLPGMAMADLVCRFETECLEGEDCTDSGFAMTVETGLSPGALLAEGGLPLTDQIVTDAETFPIAWSATGPALAAFGASASGFHMLSFDASGAARYSAHLPGPGLTILYIGTCGAD